MGNINSNNWMVTFYYEQELRSKYMNGILNGGFHPGVYNANISLYTVGGSVGEGSDGIYAYIKKGTTLIFSNGYNYNKQLNEEYERNLEEIGSYLVKAVALEDISVPLITWSTSTPGSLSINTAGFLRKNRNHQHYLMARLNYDPESPKSSVPYIFLTDKFSDWSLSTRNEKTYFKPPKIENDYEGINDSFTIPDGTKNFYNRKDLLNQISWLCLGIINEKPIEANENILSTDMAGASYVESYLTLTAESDDDNTTPVWLGRSASENPPIITGDLLWLKNHVFTGRGLPEYRYSLAYNYRSQSPDFFLENIVDLNEDNTIASAKNHLYLDLKNLNTGNNIINKEEDWYKVQRIGKFSNSNLPEPDFTFTLENKDLDKSIIDELSSFKNSGASGSKTICDLLFLIVPGELTNTKPKSLPFNKLQQSTIINDMFKKEQLKTISLRWLTNDDILNLSPGTDDEASFLTYLQDPLSPAKSTGDSFNLVLTHKGYSTENSAGQSYINQKLIIPLDVSISNFDRLINIIKNSNIVGKAISYMREHNMIPNTAGSLIPICVAFRKFKNTAVANNENTTPQINENIKLVSTDNYSTVNFVNPANVLNFLDLNYRITSVNNIDLKQENIYSVLPIIK